jgi:ABC-type lipoprotein release transport system permease subunit
MKSEDDVQRHEAEALEEGPKISIIERKIPFFLISRHLRRGNKWTLALVIFLMSVAFINLVFINSLFNGIVERADEQVIATTSGNITMQPSRGSQYISDEEDVVEKGWGPARAQWSRRASCTAASRAATRYTRSSRPWRRRPPTSTRR